MASIRCKVCGEPWEVNGPYSEDMAWWEAELFKKGAGCPACEGVASNDGVDHEIEHMRDVLFDSPEDPDDYDAMHLVDAPEWKEPDPKKLWQCASCNVQVVINNDAPYVGAKISDNDIFLEWNGGDKVHYQGSPTAYSYGDLVRADDPTREPEYMLEDKPRCPGCADTCYECNAVILIREEVESDQPGASEAHPSYPHHSVCMECFYNLEDEDDEQWRIED